jgi:hypothetical protein
MPRNMSFAITTQQVINETKTVTRRNAWWNAKVGQLIFACKKCMGLKKGEKVERLKLICLTDVRKEPLNAITPEDVVREGFPEMTTAEFIEMFCRTHKGVTPDTEIMRLEYKYISKANND